ncbi:MAG: bifunctional alpha/beta hydrolase/OsmC family protein [Pseudomonadota bacterium]
MRERVEFLSHGVKLAGALELPDEDPRFYALFAHCFTCGKDVAAATRISRALTAQGIAVLRFDFTGLGNSDGDFANTNFSSNVQDLLAAVEFLRAEYDAPQLLIGHSLGGAAVLAMAAQVPEAKAVATIGAPHRAEHVAKNFAADIPAIQRDGEAEVQLAGRTFTIKKQFVDDLESYDSTHLGKLRTALLIMHSPVDATVSIKEAEKIYLDALHPKSFVTLDDADHLLTSKQDSEYAARLIAAWASRYLQTEEPPKRPPVAQGEVLIQEKNQRFTELVFSDNHQWLADEPKSVGGADLGPDPYEHLLAALGTCTVMTLRMYAQRKSLPLTNIEVRLRHDREHLTDCDGCEEKERKIEVLERVVLLEGDLSVEQRKRLLEIADRCPVHRTLHSQLEVRTSLLRPE